MDLWGVCSSVLVLPPDNFHLALKSLFRNSERIYQSVFIPDFRAGRQAGSAWPNDVISAGKPWTGSVRRVEQSPQPVVGVGRFSFCLLSIVMVQAS